MLNSISANGHYDIFTVEQWSNTHGIRKYFLFADIYNDVFYPYCSDSLDQIKLEGTFTNDCWAKFSVETLSPDSQWIPVEIKSIEKGTVEILPSNTYQAKVYCYAGWTNEFPVKLQLSLPIENYALGGRLRIKMKLYPEYADTNFYEFTERTYEVNIKKTCLPKPGGCPFLYIKNDSLEYKVDNNLLHRSEFSTPEIDIRDLYKIQIKPTFSNHSQLEAAIIENENDVSYINQVKMYAVDYPIGKKLAVTEGNDIVLYDSIYVTASDSVMRYVNGFSINATSNVNYHNPGSPIIASADDSMYANFSYGDKRLNSKNKDNAKRLIDLNRAKAINSDIRAPLNVAFVSDLSNINPLIPAAKDTSGYLIANSVNLEVFTGIFSRRELNSTVVLPLFQTEDIVDNFKIHWQSDFTMKNLGIAYLDYEGFTQTEMTLNEGNSLTISTDSSKIEELIDNDNNYAIVNAETMLKLKFGTSNLPELPKESKREYIIEVNGYYLNGDTSSLLRKSVVEIPAVYKLSQNYPNPFNPVTKINYELPKNSIVNLVIYDILGREVIKLVNNEIQQAGRFTVEFNAQNYASGVYFYRIEAGSFVQSKKMILLK
ncbi:MAG: T9SS type A sorting domain-containing protein [Ignavibacteria bacterium]|nr:T9SS type A sorting domain-containing protein [Ignavibacteria bacterium]